MHRHTCTCTCAADLSPEVPPANFCYSSHWTEVHGCEFPWRCLWPAQTGARKAEGCEEHSSLVTAESTRGWECLSQLDQAQSSSPSEQLLPSPTICHRAWHEPAWSRSELRAELGAGRARCRQLATPNPLLPSSCDSTWFSSRKPWDFSAFCWCTWKISAHSEYEFPGN